MPTAARLIAALTFAAVGFFAAETYKPGLPAFSQWGWFSSLTALIGLICGWRVVGRLAGQGFVPSMAAGLRTSFTLVLFTLLLFSVIRMLQLTLYKRYNGVFDALLGVFELISNYGAALLRPDPLIVLIAGGLLGGLFAEWAARRWS